jgi:flagellin
MPGIRLGTNIDSLAAQSELDRTTSDLSKIYERLSSGLRINHASDDAAGLSVATSLSTQSRIYAQAARNLNDGISALQIGSSALDSLMDITIRQKELATQAAQGTLSVNQRTALNNEAQALALEYNRIIATTTFNNNQLISAPNTVSIQAGIGVDESLQITQGASLSYTNTTTIAGVSALVSGGTDESALFSNFNLGHTTQEVQFADSSSFSSGNYFWLNTQAGGVIVWYNKDGGGGAPSYSSGLGIEVDISSGDSNLTIASKTAAALNGNSLLAGASAVGSDVFVGFAPAIGYSSLGYGAGVGSAFYDYGHTTDVNPTVGVTGYGAGGNYGYGVKFNISTPTQNYYVWTNIGYGHDPGGPGTGIEVDLLVTDSASTVASKVAAAITAAAGSSFSVSANSGNVTITNKSWGAPLSAWTIGGTALGISHLASGANPTSINLGTDQFTSANHGFSTGDAVTVSLNGGGGLPAPLSPASTYYIIKVDNNNFKLASSAANAQSGIAINITSFGSIYASLTFASGSTTTTTVSANAQSFSLLSQSSSQSALDTLESQFQRVLAEQGSNGAFMSRLSIALNVVKDRQLEYTAAASRIMDDDIAADAANLVRDQILLQAGSAVLAHANLESGLALKLLSG